MPIEAAVDPSPVTLPEFKAHLNLSASTSESDTELTVHLQAAVEAVEKRIGPLLTREFTERVEARNGALVVNKTPLVAVTGLTEVASGVAWSTAEYDVDPSGVITGALGRRLPRTRFDVTYTAGYGTTVIDRHRLAVLYVAEHLWEMQRRGVSARPGLFGENDGAAGGETSATFVYRGFALPRRALELLAGDEEIGFA